MELTTPEKRVLKALLDSPRSEKELTVSTGMKVDFAMQVAFTLAEKKLVRVKERREKIYSLTKEGERYAQQGLPERRAYEFLRSRKKIFPLELEKILQPEEVAISLGWLRRKKWARWAPDGSILPLDAPPGEDEKLLLLLSSSPSPAEEKIAENLVRRKLAVSRERVERKIEITEEGRNEIRRESLLEEEITALTPEILKSGEWREKKIREYDVVIPAERIYPAKRNPYGRILERIRRIFLEMGFKEIKDDIVQSSFWNFDALFQPQDHPARDMQDTFYLEEEEELPEKLVKRVKDVHECGKGAFSKGWGYPWRESLARKKVLRTHTTTLTIRYLAEHPEPPVKVFCIDRVYRREAIDATHLPEFDQVEGIVMDKNVSFKNLLGCLSVFYEKMGFPKVRFRPGYFPYTEPSLEVEVYFQNKWIELGGAGIFRQEVTRPLGIKYPVLAWGLGSGRLAMILLGLSDLRELYSPDAEWIRKCPLR